MSGTIILVGYRGVGKTSVGTMLAGKLGYAFFDTDQEIERLKGAKINEIVASEGWQGFRECEKKVICSLKELTDTVIATGGGAVLHNREWQGLKDLAFIVWLRADEQVIIDRIRNDGLSSSQRPSLTGEETEQETARILRERLPLYKRLADITIDSGILGVDDIVMEIEKVIAKRKEQ